MKYLVLVLALLVSDARADELVNKLQEISVTINAGGSQGSGVLFNRQVGEEVRTYVWTAAHVVKSLRGTRTVIINGTKKDVVEFSDANIIREFTENGRRIGEQKMQCRVVRYSDADHGEDLALLEVRKRNFVPLESSAVFYLDDEIPGIGTKLCHVGSLLGQVGANSYTEGVVSQIGRVLNINADGQVFDQTTATAFPGSSGGGVFLQSDGRYIGMLVRGAGEQFNLIVPARRLKTWAKSSGVEWAIDDSVQVPGDAELKKLPVEDVGVEFSKDAANAAADAKSHPFLLKIQEN